MKSNNILIKIIAVIILVLFFNSAKNLIMLALEKIHPATETTGLAYMVDFLGKTIIMWILLTSTSKGLVSIIHLGFLSNSQHSRTILEFTMNFVKIFMELVISVHLIIVSLLLVDSLLLASVIAMGLIKIIINTNSNTSSDYAIVSNLSEDFEKAIIQNHNRQNTDWSFQLDSTNSKGKTVINIDMKYLKNALDSDFYNNEFEEVDIKDFRKESDNSD